MLRGKEQRDLNGAAATFDARGPGPPRGHAGQGQAGVPHNGVRHKGRCSVIESRSTVCCTNKHGHRLRERGFSSQNL